MLALSLAAVSAAPATPLQSATVSVLATYALFAVFLSFTAFLAARNLLGDVSLRRHALVGPPLAAIAFLAATFEFPPFLALAAALAVDAAAFRYLHDLDRRLLAGVVLIHFVVSVILGAVLFSLVALISSAPG
ncbi:hypothetical protein JCM30237_09950 [Halolamina litorea]|jgi:hypothetical protein|uniref:Uncharacterized protein n=1 Tax=Halolamina litorea TaxID=1515593 RepID=A0ABD6BVW5_9EURY|nr:hypothetical protein [Halolamina litorea]